MKTVIQPLAKSVLIPLGLKAVASPADGKNTTLIISNDEMKDILKIVKSLENSGLLLEVNETIRNEAKEQKGGFVSMLLGPLGASLLGNMLADKGVLRAGEGTAIHGYGTKKSSLKKMFDSTPSINKL